MEPKRFSVWSGRVTARIKGQHTNNGCLIMDNIAMKNAKPLLEKDAYSICNKLNNTKDKYKLAELIKKYF